jgi:hypothetical protein
MTGRAVLLLAVVVAVIAAGIGFAVGRSTDSDSPASTGSPDPLPRSAPSELVRRCDIADGIWLDRRAAVGSPLISHLAMFAHVPGCYRQIGPATAWILDLSYSGDIARQWAQANHLSQRDVVDLTIGSTQ